MAQKNFDEALVEAMTAAQAILSFHGYGDKIINKIGIAERSKIQEGSDVADTELTMRCCLWDCTVTNNGACICRQWC